MLTWGGHHPSGGGNGHHHDVVRDQSLIIVSIYWFPGHLITVVEVGLAAMICLGPTLGYRVLAEAWLGPPGRQGPTPGPDGDAWEDEI